MRRVLAQVERKVLFQDCLVYNNNLHDQDHVTESTTIYTYKLMIDYKASNFEVIPGGFSMKRSELDKKISLIFFTFYHLSNSPHRTVFLGFF